MFCYFRSGLRRLTTQLTQDTRRASAINENDRPGSRWLQALDCAVTPSHAKGMWPAYSQLFNSVVRASVLAEARQKKRKKPGRATYVRLCVPSPDVKRPANLS